MTAIDIDKDGDLDLVCPGKSGLYLFENLRANRNDRGMRPMGGSSQSLRKDRIAECGFRRPESACPIVVSDLFGIRHPFSGIDPFTTPHSGGSSRRAHLGGSRGERP